LKFLPEHIQKSVFKRDVITLLTGQLVAQGISFLVGFIITRLYLPEQIGSYSLFVAIATVLTIVATGRYDVAIVVEEEEKKAQSLWSLSLIISLFFNVILFVVLFAFTPLILAQLNTKELGGWILLLPAVVFISTITKATQFYFQREGVFSEMKNSDITKSVFNSIFSVAFGWIKMLSGGLIVANLIANLTSTLYLLFKLPSKFWNYLIASIQLDALKDVATKYSSYLKIHTISGLLNAIVSNGTPLFIVFFFTETIAGYYFMAEKVVSIPLSLIVTSISQVFHQKATALYRDDKKQFLALIYKIQKKMVYVLLPLLLGLSLIAPYFFRLFGEGWEQAGEMVKYFALLVFFNNLVSPVGAISNIIDRLDLLLYFNISIALFRGLTFYVGSLYLSFEYSLLLSSVVLSACYLLFDYVLKKRIKAAIIA